MTPDGRHMLIWSRPDFVLWDLDSGETARSAYPLEAYSVLSMEFSADGAQAVYVQREDCFREDAASAVVLLDHRTMEHEVLLEASNPGYVRAAWETPDSVILQDFNGDFYRLVLSTGAIAPWD